MTYLSAPALQTLTGISHGFFTRQGGVSQGLYATNNCAYGAADAREAVTNNRATCIKHLALNSLVTGYQRHTADVVEVKEPWSPEAAPVADGLVTRSPGIGLGILTADCVPVLFADAEAKVVGAAHAGWRGAFDGVLQNTVMAMAKLGAEPSRMVAVVGPCIAQASYEVGPEFVATFMKRDSVNERYFTPPKANGHSHFDLARFAADRLRSAGVATVAIDGRDTCANEATFFSFRRSTLKREPDYGRQISIVGLALT